MVRVTSPDRAEGDENPYRANFATASDLEAAFDFIAASRHYLIAADFAESGSSDEVQALMRAASCMERQQNWRADSATWEKIGQRLGGQPSPSNAGQSGMFHLISYGDWETALTQHIPDRISSQSDGHESDTQTVSDEEMERARVAQRRAWAYQWAAEEVEYQKRFGHARGLYRKAGLTFLESADQAIWRCSPALQARLYETAGWCFFRAAWCNWQPGNLELPDLDRRRFARMSEDRFNVPWAPSQLFENCSGHDSDVMKTDLTRMQEAYSRSGEVRGSMAIAYDQITYQMSELQALLHLTGDRQQSRRVYAIKRRYERWADLAELRNLDSEKRLFAGKTSDSVALRAARLCVRMAASYVGWILTGNNASVTRTALSLLTLYCVVFPILYFNRMTPSAGFMPDSTPRWLEALILSLLNTVSLSPNRFEVESVIGNLLQAAQGWSAFVALGYLIWLVTRQFDS